MTTQSKVMPAVTPSETASEFQTGQVLTIVGGHFVHDTFSAFLSPLLPRIIESLSLSLTQAGALWGFSQYPMLLTPFIGHLADRLSLRYFVILAPAVTATVLIPSAWQARAVSMAYSAQITGSLYVNATLWQPSCEAA